MRVCHRKVISFEITVLETYVECDVEMMSRPSYNRDRADASLFPHRCRVSAAEAGLSVVGFEMLFP